MLALARGPGVVDLVAAGEDVDGAAWLRTGYLAGGTLSEVARTHGEVATMAALAQVATTLADLHDRGIVHGRLSPDHVVGGAGGATLCGFSAAVASVTGGRVEPGIDVGAFAELVAGTLTAEDDRSRRARRSAGGLSGPSPVTNLRAVAAELAGLAAEGGWVQPRPAADTGGGGGGPASQPAGVLRGGRRAHAHGSADIGWGGSRVLAPHAARGVHRSAGSAGRPARLGLLGAGVAAAVALVAVGALVLGRDEAPGRSVPTDLSGAAAPPSTPPTSTQTPPTSTQTPSTSTQAPPTSAPTTADVSLPTQVWPDPEPVLDDDPAPAAVEVPELVAAVVEHDGVRYRIGRPGDIVVVGDWDCDGAPTPSVVRPGDGSIWSFRSWASGGEVVVAEALGYAAAPVAATATPEREGCDVLAITTADGRRVVVRPG